ncbi:hypothetical protein FACS1894192_11400 [Bacilli bacterium]|nr:hypothetical protein FACS1894192_11400 [Bacilli bacterium]GHU46463.1 hypothetical protein FACS1894194_4160 [Bacilli bacterium]
MNKQFKLKQSGDSESFKILKYEPNSDTWETAFDIEQDATNRAYKIKNNEQIFVVYDKFEKVSKTERILGRDLQKSDNKVVRKRVHNFLKIAYWQSYFENNGEIYSKDLLSSGTKGIIYPVNKNGVPIAVFSRSTIKINGQFQLELSVAAWATDEEVNHIILFYIAEYIATHNLSDVGLLSVNVNVSYAFNNRKILTQEHLNMLPLEKRPTKFEAFSWYYAGLALIYPLFAIKVMNYTLKPLLIALGCIGAIYLIILGIVILTKNIKGSK